MHRRSTSIALSVAALTALAIAACSTTPVATTSGPTQPPIGASQPVSTAIATPASSAAAGGSLADAAARVSDPCSIFPLAIAKPLVPKSTGPQGQASPLSCEITDGTSSVVVTIAATETEPPASAAQSVTAMGAGAFVEQRGPGDTYLTVLLTPERGRIHVEIATPDGRDHTSEAIAIAQAVLAKLG